MDLQLAAAMEKYPSFRKAVETGIESHDGREERLLSYILSRSDLDQIRGSPAKLLTAIDEFSSTEDFLISIGGHKAGILSDLIAKEQPKTVMELGGYLGYSAVLFADAMRCALGSSEGLRVWSIEMSAEFAPTARQLIDLAGLADIVTVVVGTAEQTLRSLHGEGKVKAVDLLFLDHSEKQYPADFKVCVELGFFGPGAPEYREMVRVYPGLVSEGVRGLIQPGEFEDELEISRVVTSKLSPA